MQGSQYVLLVQSDGLEARLRVMLLPNDTRVTLLNNFAN